MLSLNWERKRTNKKKQTDFERGIVCGMHHGAAPGDWGGHVWGSFSCGVTGRAERSLRLHVRCPPFSRPLCSRIMKSLFILRKLKHHRPSLPRLLSWRRFCHNKRAKQRMDCLFIFIFLLLAFVQTKRSLQLFYLLLVLKELISLRPKGATLWLWLTSGLIYTITEPFFFFFFNWNTT